MRLTPGGNPNLDKNLDKELGAYPSSPGELGQGTWTTAGCRVTSSLSVLRPNSRQDPTPCASPREPELGQGTWTNFITCFPLAEPLVQVRPGNLDKELGQLRAAVLQALSVLRPDSRQAPIPQLGPGRKPELGQELGQVLSRVFLLQSHLSKFARGTWTRNLDNCGLPRYKLSRQAPIPQLGPGRKPELGQELGQGTWTSFITCFPLAEPLVQVRPENLDKELGQLRVTPRFQAGPDSATSLFRGGFPNGFYST